MLDEINCRAIADRGQRERPTELKRYLTVGALIATIVTITISHVISTQGIKIFAARKLNILIVSACSVRPDLLQFYGGTSHTLPHLEQFLAKSHIRFPNAINGLNWTAIFAYTMTLMGPDFFAGLRYHTFGRPVSPQLFRIPLRRFPEAGEIINENDFEKDVKSTMRQAKKLILSRHNEPFFMIAHIKYMHYPFIDRFNLDSEWDYFLSQDEKQRVKTYIENPQKFYRKLPFLLLLTNDARLAANHPKIKSLAEPLTDVAARQLTGLITNRELLNDWQATTDFADDLEILKKIYRANARYLDKLISPMLDLYGDKRLKENTIVVFAGDHGETHMERGELTHGLSLYDESLKVPLAIRFPGLRETAPVDIEHQVSFNTFAKVIRQMLLGENSMKDVLENLKLYRDDVVVGRNCANTIRGLRFANKYKYFKNIESGQRFLFDLQKDPKELQNLVLLEPDKANEMEALYWKNFARFEDHDVYGCFIQTREEDSENISD